MPCSSLRQPACCPRRADRSRRGNTSVGHRQSAGIREASATIPCATIPWATIPWATIPWATIPWATIPWATISRHGDNGLGIAAERLAIRRVTPGRRPAGDTG
jgi:hypothetical protein